MWFCTDGIIAPRRVTDGGCEVHEEEAMETFELLRFHDTISSEVPRARPASPLRPYRERPTTPLPWSAIGFRTPLLSREATILARLASHRIPWDLSGGRFRAHDRKDPNRLKTLAFLALASKLRCVPIRLEVVFPAHPKLRHRVRRIVGDAQLPTRRETDATSRAMRARVSSTRNTSFSMTNLARRRTRNREERNARRSKSRDFVDASGREENDARKKKLADRAPEGASTDVRLVLGRFWKIASPYWTDPEVRGEALTRAAVLIGITVATTGISVWFNFLGRDFYNALAEKDVARFWTQLSIYLGAFVVGIPVFVFRDYLQSILGLKWREWMTDKYLEKYFANRKYYDIQSEQLVDNPDQRINDDIRSFTDAALGFFLTIFNSVLDLISFSAIMFSIYPPLFIALLLYAIGGTGISLWLGRNLVVLNFMQEQREADFRYSLVRIRENAESIAFYNGEKNEKKILIDRFSSVLENFLELVTTSRNLNFFTSFYRLLIQLVPLAVVAPQYFKGAIELGVVNQSSSAFNHILSDVSLVVYQIETIAGLSAVVDRLGEFVDVLESTPEDRPKEGRPRIVFSAPASILEGKTLLQAKGLSLNTPDYQQTLFRDLEFSVSVGESLLIMGPSGSGKTSLLRVLAGLWDSGHGEVLNFAGAHARASASSYTGTFFLPQRPYMVLGTLREQLLYPTWTAGQDGMDAPDSTFPAEEELLDAMKRVKLGYLVDRFADLDEKADWSAMLSLGEQQRLAFARLLLARPSLALMDECTSAMDEANEMHLYSLLAESGITYISIGHRSSLKQYHKRLLSFSPSESPGSGAAWELGTCSKVEEDVR